MQLWKSDYSKDEKYPKGGKLKLKDKKLGLDSFLLYFQTE
jgi:hypothetical protein